MPPKTFEEGKAKAAEKQNRNVAKAEIVKAISRYIPNFDFKTNKLPPATKKGMKEKYDTFYNTILKPAIESNQNDPYIIKLLRTFISEITPQESKERETKEREVKVPEPQPQAVETPAVAPPSADDILSTNELTAFLVNQERKAEAKTNARKAIAEKLKQDIKRLKAEAKAEAKAQARALVANRRGMASEDINRAPVERKREFKMGISDLIRAQPAREPPVATASPAIAPPAIAPTTNLAQLVATQSDVLEQKTRVPRQPRLTRQQTPEQFLQENLDDFVREEKEPEVKEQPLTTGRSFANRMIDAIGSLTFSGMFAVISSYALRTNNKDLGNYIAPLGGALGALAYRKISDFKDGASEILDKVSKLGGSPDDIIGAAKRAKRPDIRPDDDEPPAPSGRPSEPPPQKSVDDFKGETKQLPPKPPLQLRPKKAVSDADTEKAIDEAFRARRSVGRVYDEGKSVPRVAAEFARDVGIGAYNVADAVVRGVTSGIRDISNDVYQSLSFDNGGMGENMPDYILPRSYEGSFPIPEGKTVQYMDEGDPNEDVFLDRETPVPEGFADARDYDGSRPRSGVGDRFGRARRVASNIAQSRLARGAALAAGAGAVTAGVANILKGSPTVPTTTPTGPETKTDVRPTINEAPIILKNDELNQDQAENIKEGKDKDDVRRGAGILKPKFIVPSVNIFNKTEQEQYVDDIEFAMFDFVQDDSGGNDPTGTNPILRDQTLSQGLRYQRAGVTINSLYGKNLPDNPKNMTQAMMDELFLGEPLLPTMKFLFSEEFNTQEFNLSEFEVNNYDVNNELTAVEMLSPYANFTNNQLLDQFIDTSILYGVVP